MTSKFKVGDRVRVIAPGKTYEHYDVKFNELGFKSIVENCSFGKHTLAEVFGVTLHDNPNYIETLVAIRDRFGNESLISETGIELIDEIEFEMPMTTNEVRLAYARKHYPIGTEYIPLDSDGRSYQNCYVSVHDPEFWEGSNIDTGSGLIYHYETNQWAEITKEVVKEKETVMKTQKLSRQGLKEIHEVACGNWKTVLGSYGFRNPFEDYVELTHDEVNEMFKACDTKQRTIVSRYLTVKAPKDFESIIKNIGPVRLHDLTQGLISTRVGGKHEYKAFVLDKKFDWIMEFDDNGFLCLVPTNKD